MNSCNNMVRRSSIIQFLLLLCSGVGIPISEDIVNIPAGMLVADSPSLLWLMLIAAYVGVCCGDVLWFLVVSKFGARLLHVRWFKRLMQTSPAGEVQIDRRGAWVIVLAGSPAVGPRPSRSAVCCIFHSGSSSSPPPPAS